MAPDLAQNTSESFSKLEIADQVDLSVKSKLAPVYQYAQIYQLNNGASVNLAAAATSQSQFNISGDIVQNFARSYLTFDLVTTASTNVTAVQLDISPIDSIELRTQSGTVLTSLNNVQMFSKVMARLSPYEEYLSHGPVWAGATRAASLNSVNRLCQPAGVAAGNVASVVPNQRYWFGTAANPPVPTLSALAPDVDSGADQPFLARQLNSYSGAVGAGVAVNISFRLPLSLFVGTILAMDRDLYFGQNLTLVINWSATSRFIYDESAILLTGNAAAFAGTASLQSLYLWIAKEMNAEIVNQMRNQVQQQGLELLIPYTTCGKGGAAAGAVQQYSFNRVLTAGDGLSLKRIITVPATINETLRLNNCNDNVNAHIYTAVQSYLDASPLQQTALVCGTVPEDYNYMYQILRRASIYSARDFQQASFFCDVFGDSACEAVDWREDDTNDSGLKIGNIPKNYSIRVTSTVAGMGLYQYVTFVRKLIINPNGLQWGA